MAYRISKSDIEKLAEIIPDAYVIENGGKYLELVLQGDVDPTSANRIAEAVDDEHLEEYRKAKRKQLIDEVEEIQSFHNTTVQKRVLAAIVNDAVRSIHD